MVDNSRQDEEKVRQTVDVPESLGIDGFSPGKGHHLALTSPGNAPCQMQPRTQGSSTGQDKALQRLKHLVDDKIHARARGTHTAITRQPKEGRQQNGGFRIGYMERDNFASQGAAGFLG